MAKTVLENERANPIRTAVLRRILPNSGVKVSRKPAARNPIRGENLSRRAIKPQRKAKEIQAASISQIGVSIDNNRYFLLVKANDVNC
jgi:hypothetical protein